MRYCRPIATPMNMWLAAMLLLSLAGSLSEGKTSEISPTILLLPYEDNVTKASAELHEAVFYLAHLLENADFLVALDETTDGPDVQRAILKMEKDANGIRLRMNTVWRGEKSAYTGSGEDVFTAADSLIEAFSTASGVELKKGETLTDQEPFQLAARVSYHFERGDIHEAVQLMQRLDDSDFQELSTAMVVVLGSYYVSLQMFEEAAEMFESVDLESVADKTLLSAIAIGLATSDPLKFAPEVRECHRVLLQSDNPHLAALIEAFLLMIKGDVLEAEALFADLEKNHKLPSRSDVWGMRGTIRLAAFLTRLGCINGPYDSIFRCRTKVRELVQKRDAETLEIRALVYSDVDRAVEYAEDKFTRGTYAISVLPFRLLFGDLNESTLDTISTETSLHPAHNLLLAIYYMRIDSDLWGKWNQQSPDLNPKQTALVEKALELLKEDLANYPPDLVQKHSLLAADTLGKLGRHQEALQLLREYVARGGELTSEHHQLLARYKARK